MTLEGKRERASVTYSSLLFRGSCGAVALRVHVCVCLRVLHGPRWLLHLRIKEGGVFGLRRLDATRLGIPPYVRVPVGSNDADSQRRPRGLYTVSRYLANEDHGVPAPSWPELASFAFCTEVVITCTCRSHIPSIVFSGELNRL